MNYILYHANCADGFTAYWVTQKALTLMGQPWQGNPGKYGTSVCTDGWQAGDTLWMVDFSLPAEEVREILAKGINVFWLDHHVKAYEEYKAADLLNPSVYEEDYYKPMLTSYSYSLHKSGATVCWEYFKNTLEVMHGLTKPLLLDYIEDRDLWRHKLPGTHEVNASIFSHTYSLETWDKLMSADSVEVLQMNAAGAGILRKHMKNVEESIKEGKHVFYIDEYTVWACNVPGWMASDTCHELCTIADMFGGPIPFAATYQITGNEVKFSLRSSPEGTDVNEVAKRFGGGGHKHAAGFTVQYDKWMENRHAVFSDVWKMTEL